MREPEAVESLPEQTVMLCTPQKSMVWNLFCTAPYSFPLYSRFEAAREEKDFRRDSDPTFRGQTNRNVPAFAGSAKGLDLLISVPRAV